MNPRWREIAVTCWEERSDELQFDQEMFAKLIIDKCLQQCYNRGMNDELYEGQLQAAAYIEEYFGIQNET
jgi:hypothetical protein